MGRLVGAPRPTLDAVGRPRTDRLYVALGEIGTVHKTIDASVLARYQVILDAPAVRRLAYAGADDSTLAAIAQRVLMRIISELPVATDRRVGEAILAVGDFRGLLINDRKRHLDGLPDGCSPDSFKRRRKRVLEDICLRLLRPTMEQAIEMGIEPGNSRDDHRTQALKAIARYSAEFYADGVGTMISYSLTVKRDALADKRSGAGDALLAVWREWPVRLFYSFGLFARVVPRLLDYPRDSAEDETVTRTATLHHEAMLLAPFAPQSAELATVEQAASEYDMGLVVVNRTSHAAADLLAPVWVTWYHQQLKDSFEATASHTPELVVLLHKAAVIVREASDSDNESATPSPLLAARQRAHRALSQFHDVDGSVPLADGLSLREHTDQLFDQTDAILAKEPLMWDNVTVM
jgi:hypothetical protein